MTLYINQKGKITYRSRRDRIKFRSSHGHYKAEDKRVIKSVDLLLSSDELFCFGYIGDFIR